MNRRNQLLQLQQTLYRALGEYYTVMGAYWGATSKSSVLEVYASQVSAAQELWSAGADVQTALTAVLEHLQLMPPIEVAEEIDRIERIQDALHRELALLPAE